MAAEKHCCAAEFWVYIMIIFLLVLFAGLMSGLTLGLMSLSLVDLEVIAKSGQAQDRKHAAKILPVVRKQHLLLCTLLICNAVAMEALPIFLDSLVSAWGAILISVTLILIFGEILPQSVCSRYGLAVGAIVAPAVRVLVWICFPIAFPISKLLDYLLGDKHVALFRRAELQTLVTMHGNEAGKGGELSHDETTIISGALELTGKTVLHAMTPICETFSIGVNEKLDREKMALILEKGHSRIPVYYEQPTNIIGLILVKNLLALHLADEVVVKDVIIRKIPRVPTNMPLYDILNEFQKGHSHMAVVVRLIEEREKTTKRSMDVKLQIGIKSSNVKEVLAHGEDVRLDVDNNSPQVVQDIPFSNKNLLYAWKNFPILTRDLSKGKSRSKKWTRVMSEDILEICDPVVPTFASENEEVVGIITLEDVIEEILQEEIFDETDAYDDTNCK